MRTFGLHLARLDVRQDSRVHDDALAALLDNAAWPQLAPDTRTQQLRVYASGNARFPISHAGVVTSLYDVFATLGDARRRYGREAVGLYIISMARSAADVLAVLALARYGGLVENDSVPLNIAPLFETVDDLKNAPATLRALLEDPVYRQHLAARGDQQWVMLGYLDSGKDGGARWPSRWGLQRAQVELLAVANSRHPAGFLPRLPRFG